MRSDAPVEERLNRVKQQLQQSSYKLTPQREATVRVLIENEKDHLSAEDVYLKVKDKAPEIGLATVYRTLELFAKLKEVKPKKVLYQLYMQMPRRAFKEKKSDM